MSERAAELKALTALNAQVAIAAGSGLFRLLADAFGQEPARAAFERVRVVPALLRPAGESVSRAELAQAAGDGKAVAPHVEIGRGIQPREPCGGDHGFFGGCQLFDVCADFARPALVSAAHGQHLPQLRAARSCAGKVPKGAARSRHGPLRPGRCV